MPTEYLNANGPVMRTNFHSDDSCQPEAVFSNEVIRKGAYSPYWRQRGHRQTELRYKVKKDIEEAKAFEEECNQSKNAPKDNDNSNANPENADGAKQGDSNAIQNKGTTNTDPSLGGENLEGDIIARACCRVVNRHVLPVAFTHKHWSVAIIRINMEKYFKILRWKEKKCLAVRPHDLMSKIHDE